MFNSFRRRLRTLLAAKPRTNRRRRNFTSRPAEVLEDRALLAANLNLITAGFQTGNVVYGGSGVNNDLTVSFDGVNYTFSDPSEPINAVGGLAGLDTNPDPNVVTFSAAAADGVTPIQQIILNGNAGDDTYTINSLRNGDDEGLDVRDDAGEGNDTINIGGSLGTSGSRLGNTVILRSESVDLGGDIFTSTSKISVGDDGTGILPAVTVTADVEINSGTETAEIDSTGITGAFDLTVRGFGVQVVGDVNLTGAANIELDGTVVLVGTPGSDAALTTDTGTVSVTGQVVNLTDEIMTGGAVTITAAATSMGADAGLIQGSSVTITGTLTSTSAVDTELTASSGDVSVGGNLASNTAVTVTASGDATFSGGVAGTAIAVDATNVNARTFQASAGNVAVSGDVTFSGMDANVTSATTTILFEDSITGGSQVLSFIAPTSVELQDAVSNDALVQIVGPSSTSVATAEVADITARSIFISSALTTLNGDLSATNNGGGLVILQGGAIVVTGANREINSGGAAAQSILILSTIDGEAADTTNLTLDAGTAGDVSVGTAAIGGTTSLASLSLRGDTVTMNTINVDGDLTVNGGNILLNAAVTGDGSGTATFAPAVAGGTLDIFNDPTNTRNGTNTRIASDTLANIASGAFNDFRFGDASTAVITVNPDNDNSLATGSLELDTDTEFEAESIIVSEDLDADANTITFETDNLAMFRGVRDTGDVNINKKTAGGILELRGRIASDARWGNLDLTINAVGATVNAPDAGAALPALGLGVDQPAVNLGGSSVNLTINADTLNALAPSAIVSAGDLALNVDTLNLVGGVQTAGAGTVTIGNPGADVINTTGNILSILLPAGSDLSMSGYDGNGGNLVIRGVGGQLGTVTLDGIDDTGSVSLGTSGTNDATILNITDDITATSIVLRGDAINLDGTLTATAGNVQLVGPVTLTGDSSLINTSGLATASVRIEGTVDGAFNLDVNSGVGTAVFTQGIGQTVELASMSVVSGGLNFLTVPITVTNDFSWIIGVGSNGVNDRLIRAGAGAITSTNGPIVLEADVLQGITSGVNVIGPGQTLTQRGAGD